MGTLAATALIPALWLAWVIYWIVAARRVKPVAWRESRLSRASHHLPLLLAFGLLAPPSMPGWLGAQWIEQSWSLFVVGAGLVVAGLLFSVWARVLLGGNWSGTVTLKQGHEIVRAGPYRWIRHPIYTGLLLAFCGSALALGQWRGLIGVALLLAAYWRKIGLEERRLEQHFGAAYADYRRRSWALIPLVI
jgi:protein-S-isoprenylcysteine O-methyltransferase Ste14